MKHGSSRGAFLLCLAAVSTAVASQDAIPRSSQDDNKLPNGKSQKDEILRVEHEQNLKDAGRLVEMAEELKTELESTDRFVLSLDTLKKTDEIEKLVKKIRDRLRH